MGSALAFVLAALIAYRDGDRKTGMCAQPCAMDKFMCQIKLLRPKVGEAELSTLFWGDFILISHLNPDFGMPKSV